MGPVWGRQDMLAPWTLLSGYLQSGIQHKTSFTISSWGSSSTYCIFNTLSFILYWLIHSLWPSNAIWLDRSGSTFVQIMAWYLMATSHCLSQCWIITSVLYHSPKDDFTRNVQNTYPWYEFNKSGFKRWNIIGCLNQYICRRWTLKQLHLWSKFGDPGLNEW